MSIVYGALVRQRAGLPGADHADIDSAFQASGPQETYLTVDLELVGNREFDLAEFAML